MHHLTKAMLLVAVLLVLQACGTTVNPGERGVRWNLFTGGLGTETLKSGFHWQAPWSQIFIYNVQWRSYAETVEALSSDGLPVTIKTVILMRPTPNEVSSLAQNIGSDFYPQAVKPTLLTAVRSAVSRYPMITVLEHSPEIAGQVEAIVVEQLRGRHLQVANVAIVKLAMDKLELGLVDHTQADAVSEFSVIAADKK